MAQYDLTGIMFPILIKLEIELHKPFGKEQSELGWDDSIPTTAHQAWVKLTSELLLIGEVIVPRSVRPPTAVRPPELFLFFDGSLEAYCACVYIRWLLNSPDHLLPLRDPRWSGWVTPTRGGCPVHVGEAQFCNCDQ